LLTLGSGVALDQVVASATGSGQFHVSGDLRTFINATADSSGNTTGQTQGFNRNAGIKWHGTVKVPERCGQCSHDERGRDRHHSGPRQPVCGWIQHRVSGDR